MNPAAAKRLRLLASAISVLVLVGAAAAAWYYSRLRASLPQLEGSAPVAGLTAPVTIERDALGVPTIRGETRADVARALGWLHAQDRFFQMDTLRRDAAGELSAIVGKRTLSRDRAHRRHGFRRLAQEVVAALPENDRAVLEAYAAGANAGLAALGSAPFEYHFLRIKPEPWLPEDSILVGYAMTLDLQDETGLYEKTLMTVRDQFGPAVLDFFAPLVRPDDAALDGTDAPLAPIPGPDAIDLRKSQVGAIAPRASRHREDIFPGSNAIALGGAHTATGAGLLANDMHLDHRLPNTWYRAVLEWPAPTQNPEPKTQNLSDQTPNSKPQTPNSAAARRVAGLTLPGLPLIVSGSNGQVAWGFTAAYVDTLDLVVVDRAPGLTTYYTVPGGDAVQFEIRRETIHIRGEDPVPVEYQWTIWGPVVGKNERDRPLAARWLAHDPAAMNLGLMRMETARDAAEAVAIAHRAGMPAQNIVLADRDGAVAWTIAGRLPRRVGYDGRLPVTWVFGDRRWDGMLPPDDVPTVLHSATASGPETGRPSARIWSGNQRHVGGDALAKLGDGGYARPHRAGMLRDGLAALSDATPRDLLNVQLDDRATFLEPWHKLLLDTLSPEVVAQKSSRAGLRRYAEPWTGHASVDSVSYPIVKQFRAEVRARVFPAIFAACAAANPEFDWHLLPLEPALHALLRAKPLHLLNPEFATWDELLVAAVDDVIAFLDQQAITMPNATWGRRNTVHVRHPFSYSMPEWFTGWLDLPPVQMPGDVDMPRVQQSDHGASERLIVSPGREHEGIFHMPGGQSAHPLSPFFRAGHEAWVRGEPTPFLPGKAEHTLTLTP